jgi:DNA-binding CsgD family transcriptional regulator
MSTDTTKLAQTVTAMRPMVPAKDFEMSKRFYLELGFHPRTLTDRLVEMQLGVFSFILQSYYVREWADNFVVQVTVSDVGLWWDHIVSLDLPARYGVTTKGAAIGGLGHGRGRHRSLRRDVAARRGFCAVGLSRACAGYRECPTWGKWRHRAGSSPTGNTKGLTPASSMSFGGDSLAASTRTLATLWAEPRRAHDCGEQGLQSRLAAIADQGRNLRGFQKGPRPDIVPLRNQREIAETGRRIWPERPSPRRQYLYVGNRTSAPMALRRQRSSLGPTTWGRLRMDLDETVLDLIGGIYDCTLDPDNWNAVLPRIMGFVGGSGGGLFAHHASRRSTQIFYESGTDPRYRQLYLEKFRTLDPMFGTYFVIDVGEVFSTSTIMSHAEFRQSRFYKEWVQPQGWIDNIGVHLDRSSEAQASFVVFRNEREGIADDAARERLRLLVPHLRRAVLIGKLVEFQTAQAATFADALDGLSASVLFVDWGGRVTHANAAGRAMIADGDFLRVSHGRLLASDPDIDRTLRDLFAVAGNGDAAVGVKGVAVPLVARDGERYVAHVLSLASGARRPAGLSYAAAAALFVQKAALATSSPPEAIAKTYRLTPMELRTLLAIVEVGGVPEVAEAHGIGESTVKTHLGRLYEKTGARRHADLVKLFAGYASPLQG